MFIFLTTVSCQSTDSYSESQKETTLETKYKKFYALDNGTFRKKAERKVTLYPNGKTMQIMYEANGNNVGFSSFFYENGQLLHEGSYCQTSDTLSINDSLFIFTNPFPDIHLEVKAWFVEILPNTSYPTTLAGFSKIYFENGQQKFACIKTNEYGVWVKFWSDDGSLNKEGHIKNNEMNGIWKYYSKDGSLKEEEYEMGKRVK